jgi:hypothetical protein
LANCISFFEKRLASCFYGKKGLFHVLQTHLIPRSMPAGFIPAVLRWSERTVRGFRKFSAVRTASLGFQIRSETCEIRSQHVDAPCAIQLDQSVQQPKPRHWRKQAHPLFDAAVENTVTQKPMMKHGGVRTDDPSAVVLRIYPPAFLV